ncbi:MAG: hypothetical protein ACREBE_23005 [bacterium]
MKKLIGIVVSINIGLFAYTYEASARQTDDRTTSVPAATDVLARPAPPDQGCPPAHPFCCERDEDGDCYACAGGGVSCP